MKHAIPMIQKYMTCVPLSVEKNSSLLEAAVLMQNNSIRHLPVMNKGKIEEMGIADEIYNNPQNEYTKKLIAAIPKGNIEDIKARFAVK